MDHAPLEGFPIAPPGVNLSDFDKYVEETRELIEDRCPFIDLTPRLLAAAVKARASRELDLRGELRAKQEVTEEELEQEGITNDEDAIIDSLTHGIETQDWKDAEHEEKTEKERIKRIKLEDPVAALQDDLGDMYVEFNLIDKIAQHIEIAVEVCMSLTPLDIINLYSISKKFHQTINANLTSSIRMWVRRHAEESSEIFSFRLYRKLCIPDPVGRTNAFGTRRINPCNPKHQVVRQVPTLRWYHMVMTREIMVNDVVDCLEESSHYLPRGMERTIKKLWLLMDVATTRGRAQMLRNSVLWTRNDIYNAQMFFVKLHLYLDDPIWTPGGTSTLARLMMGQRGLSKLWSMLKGIAFKKHSDFEKLKVRYNYIPTQEQFRHALFREPVYGVDASEVGLVHLEGWGRGKGHLARPDELIPLEADRRGCDLDRHIIYMIMWGHFNHQSVELYQDAQIRALRYVRNLHEPGEFDHWNEDLPDCSEDEEDTDTPWQELTHVEKAEILKETVDPFDLDRQYIIRLRSRGIRPLNPPSGRISDDSNDENRENNAPNDTTNNNANNVDNQGNRIPPSPPLPHPWYVPEPEEDAHTRAHGTRNPDADEAIDFSALPNPADPALQPHRVAVVDTATLRSHLDGNAPVTAAITSACNTARDTAVIDFDLQDYVNRKLFGGLGIPSQIDLMERGDQAWDDYEEEDLDLGWCEYVDMINEPEEDSSLEEEKGEVEDGEAQGPRGKDKREVEFWQNEV